MKKILIASDIHNNKKVIKNLLNLAKKYNVDLIILAGDIATYDSFDPELINPLVENYKVLFVPGNCDFDEDLERIDKRAINIDKEIYFFEDISIIGIGCKNWKLKLTKKDSDELNLKFKSVKSKKIVLISHLHVKDSIAEFSGIKGDYYLKKIILNNQPIVAFCGHVHEAEGMVDEIEKTKIIQVGKSGIIFEI